MAEHEAGGELAQHLELIHEQDETPVAVGEVLEVVLDPELVDVLVQIDVYLGIGALQGASDAPVEGVRPVSRKLRIGEDVPELLQCDLDMELDAIPDLRAGIAYCEAHKDYVTRELFDSILRSEEEHVDWLETQLELLEKVGLQNYQQSQI